MSSNLVYLWEHRERPKVLSPAWSKSWAKRVLHLRALLRANWRRAKLEAAGVQLGPMAEIGELKLNGPGRNLFIGAECAIVGEVRIALHAPVRIGDRVVINDGVRILTGEHDVYDPAWRMTAAPIRIEDYAWVAEGAIILPGVRIGKGAVVGAGAVVTKDVPDFAIAVGNPARILDKKRCTRFCYSPVRFLATYEAWLGH